MSDLMLAYLEGKPEKMMRILQERYPDAPEGTMGLTAIILFTQCKTPDQLAEVEETLDEYVERVKQEWENGEW